MDEIDFTISMMLAMNSRIPYRELAETFNMSVNSIYKRIKSMVDSDILHNFNTKLSLLNFPNSINVVMFGSSRIKNKEGLLQTLGDHECIYNVTQSSGDLIYIHAHIRNFNELDPLISYVKQSGEINDLEIGLDSAAPPPHIPQTSEAAQKSKMDNSEEQGDIKLSKLDFLIINALKDNSRKPVSDIADEIGTSTKTVRRHLNRLREKKLIDFSIEWYPDKSAVIISIIILKINHSVEVDKSKLMEQLRKTYGQTLLFSWNLSNLPNLMLVCVWTHTMKELQELEASLMPNNFDSVNVTILIKGKMFPTWRDTYLEHKIKEIKENLA